MKRMLLGTYAVIAWLGFLAAVVWAIAFLANISPATTIDGPARTSTTLAVVIDAGLLGLFALHHSVMARPAAKRMLTRLVPEAAERSTYVLTADLLLALVLWQWHGIPTGIWTAHGLTRDLVWVLYSVGWAIAVASTFMIDHLDLFGLRQALGRRSHPPAFRARWLYRVVRHPLMLGLLIAFWSTPSMTVGHLIFAGLASGYVAIGIWFEERDLRVELGPAYLAYAATTPAIVPGLSRSR